MKWDFLFFSIAQDSGNPEARGAVLGEQVGLPRVPERGVQAAGDHHLVEEGKVHGKSQRKGEFY